MFKRTLDLSASLFKKSLFLLGPRQTGKSTLLRHQYDTAAYIDLLDPPTFRFLSAHPEDIEDVIVGSPTFIKNKTAPCIVIIDEIQKCPQLLEMVHKLIEKHKNWRFILTGSSARKLRNSGTNLLGGRAHLYNLFPLTTLELNGEWQKLIQSGGLPPFVNSTTLSQDLQAYLGLYLKEEIQAEAITRSLPDFSRFLNVAGQCNGQQIIFEKVASDCGISSKVVKSYFQILDDTLIANLLPCFQFSQKRKAVASPKLYFFDVGVANALKGIGSTILQDTALFGESFEHLVYLEIKAYCCYLNKGAEIYYWRTTSKSEVDFIIKTPDELIAIEVKGKEFLSPKDFKGLLAFAEDFPKAKKFIVCSRGVSRMTTDKIHILEAKDFFKRLWQGDLF